MYQITCDDEIMYDVRLKDRQVLSPILDLEVEKNGTLSFTIPSNNKLYNKLQQKKSIIKVYQIDKVDNKTIRTELFRGTAYSETVDFWKRKHVECEGELSFLNDSIVRPYNFQGGVEQLFKQYVNNHNSQVNKEKQFKSRKCTVVDPNDYITRANINYPTTKAEMSEKLTDILGGHFETGENEDNSRYIDYLSEYENISSQTIEFGRNLLDITQYIKTEDIATRIIPLGEKDEDGNYLNIKSVNNGLDYIQDDVAISLFGVIEKTKEFEDVTIAKNLLTKGKEYLNEIINKNVSIELSATDLHNLDVNIEAFRIGEYVKVISRPHALDRFFLLSKLHLTLDSISSCSMTLGAIFKLFTQKQIETEKQLNVNVVNAVNNATEAKKQVQEINQAIVDIPNKYVETTVFEKYKTEINEKLFGIYVIKGNVKDYETLLKIQDNNVGDVYNVLDTGANYVWTDELKWDKLSETIDLSNYYTKKEIDEMVKNLNGGAGNG